MPEGNQHGTVQTYTLIDLIEFSKLLKSKKQYRKLENLIFKCFSASSSEIDLLTCQQCLDNIKKLQEQDIGINVDMVDSLISELLFKAIIFYCRATKTSSRFRDFVPVTKNYCEHALVLHKDIVSLRDEVIAHYGPGKGHSHGFWVKEALVLVAVGDVGFIKNPWSHANYRHETIISLITLIEIALDSIVIIKKQRESEFFDEFHYLSSQGDKFIIENISKFDFDPHAFFINPSFAERFSESIWRGINFQSTSRTTGGAIK